MTIRTAKLRISAVDRASAVFERVQTSMNKLNKSVRANSIKLHNMRSGMFGAAATGYVLARALASPIKQAMAFESAMADVGKVVDFKRPNGLKLMGKDITEMSKRIPMTAKALAAITASAGGAGMGENEVLKFTEMAAKVGVAFEMPAAKVGDSLTSIKTALKLTVAETSTMADAINHLSNKVAAKAPQLVNYMKRVAASGKTYGFVRTDTIAIGAAMIAAGAEADVAATSFRNMGKALSRGESATGRQRKALKKLGLDSKKVAKAMSGNAKDTLLNVLKRIRDTVPKHQRASVISDFFGDEARGIAPLIENFELLETTLSQVSAEANYLGSSQKEYEVRAKTTANAMTLFNNKVTALSQSIGFALLPAVNSLMEGLGPIINSIATFTEKNRELTKWIVALIAGFVGLKVATFALRFSWLQLTGSYLGLKGALLKSRKVLAKTSGGLAKLGARVGKTMPLIGRLIGGLSLIPGPLGLIAVAITAVVTAGFAISSLGDNFDHIGEAAKKHPEIYARITKGLTSIRKEAGTTAEAFKDLNENQVRLRLIDIEQEILKLEKRNAANWKDANDKGIFDLSYNDLARKTAGAVYPDYLRYKNGDISLKQLDKVMSDVISGLIDELVDLQEQIKAEANPRAKIIKQKAYAATKKDINLLQMLLAGEVEKVAKKEHAADAKKLIKKTSKPGSNGLETKIETSPLPLVRPKAVLPLKRPEFEGQAAKPAAKPKTDHVQEQWVRENLGVGSWDTLKSRIAKRQSSASASGKPDASAGMINLAPQVNKTNNTSFTFGDIVINNTVNLEEIGEYVKQQISQDLATSLSGLQVDKD